MLKKRLIFALLWRDGRYCLSRNFKLQSAGDLAWIKKNYNFKVIAFSIDELIILNVSRGEKQMDAFAESVSHVTRDCFVPLAVGGGVRSVEDAEKLLGAGADKLVLNTAFFTNRALVQELVRRYGSQCVVASIDYRMANGVPVVAIDNGSTVALLSLEDAVAAAQEAGAGEIFLTSIDRDGTGQGYDMQTLERVDALATVPVIASGGVGRSEHLASWLTRPHASAASTANIFNFLGDGLVETRAELAAVGVPLAQWDFDWRG